MATCHPLHFGLLLQGAIQSEVDSLEKHETWQRVKLPEGSKAFGTYFVLCRKYNQYSTVSKYKARLVVKGYM